jgi:hypothetical protein
MQVCIDPGYFHNTHGTSILDAALFAGISQTSGLNRYPPLALYSR